jgi:hypothetical protein
MLQVTYLLLSLKNRLSTEREDMPCPGIQGFRRLWRVYYLDAQLVEPALAVKSRPSSSFLWG